MAKIKQPTEAQIRRKNLNNYYNEINGIDTAQTDASFFINNNTSYSDPNYTDSTPDYLQGVNPLSGNFDYTATSYDDDITPEILDMPDVLQDMRANNQGVASSLGNSLVNFLGKTVVNVAGGLTGLAYGGTKAIATGDFTNIWDNEWFQALDKTSDSIGETFKVYKSSDYDDRFILSKMVSHPLMFTDEFMDTLSFTAGAVVTELLSSGLASASVAGRAANYFGKLSRASKIASLTDDTGRLLNIAQRAGQASSLLGGLEKAGRLTRQLGTGAFWESSVEARHLGKEMKDKMVNDYINDMADQGINVDANNIPQEVLDDIDNRVDSASAATMALNVGLVGYSNLSQFPSIFKTAGNAKRALNKSVSGNIIAEGDRYVSRFDKMSKWQKAASRVWAGAKNPFMEGFVEEGGQGVISGTMGSFFDRKNDIDSESDVDRFLTSFSNAFLDTYTTKEGLNEVLMGALIGGVGSPGRGALSVLGKENSLGRLGYDVTEDNEGNKQYTRRELWDGGIASGLQEYSQELANTQSIVQELNSSPQLLTALKSNYDKMIRDNSIIKNMEEAIDNDDTYSYNNGKEDLLFSFLNNRIKLGLTSDIDNKIQDIEDLTPEEVYIAFKGEEDNNIATEDMRQYFKESILDNLKTTYDNTLKAFNIVDGLSFTDDRLMDDGFHMDLVYNLAKADMISNREKEMFSELKRLTTLNGEKLSYVSPFAWNRGNVHSINQRIQYLDNLYKSSEDSENKTNLKEQLDYLKDIKKQYNIGYAPFDLISDIGRFEESNPTEYNKNKDEIKSILSDLNKVYKDKDFFLKTYNNLVTKAGYSRWNDMLKLTEDFQKQFIENDIKAQEDAVIEQEEALKESELTAEVNSLTETPEAFIEEVSEEESTVVEEPIVETTPITEEIITEDNLSESIVDIEFNKYEQLDPNLLTKLIPLVSNRTEQNIAETKELYINFRNQNIPHDGVGSINDMDNARSFIASKKDEGYFTNTISEKDIEIVDDTDSQIETTIEEDNEVEETPDTFINIVKTQHATIGPDGSSIVTRPNPDRKTPFLIVTDDKGNNYVTIDFNNRIALENAINFYDVYLDPFGNALNSASNGKYIQLADKRYFKVTKNGDRYNLDERLLFVYSNNPNGDIFINNTQDTDLGVAEETNTEIPETLDMSSVEGDVVEAPEAFSEQLLQERLEEKKSNNISDNNSDSNNDVTSINNQFYENSPAQKELQDRFLGRSLVNVQGKLQYKNNQSSFERDNLGEIVLHDTYPVDALNPNLANAGSKLDIKIATREEYENYARTAKDSYDTIINDSETLPLMAMSQGKFVGFILTPKSASNSRNNLQGEDLNRLKALRESIFRNRDKTYSINVLQKSTGLVTYRMVNNRQVFRPIQESLYKNGGLAEGVSIVMDIQGILQKSDGTEFEGIINNNQFETSGQILAMIPTANGSYYHTQIKLGDVNDNEAEAVSQMIELILANSSFKDDYNRGLVSERNNLTNKGLNIGSLGQFYQTVKQLIYIENSNTSSNQFLRNNRDGSFTLSTPKGIKQTFNISDFNNELGRVQIKEFLMANFYRGVTKEQFHSGIYYAPVLDENRRLTVQSYPNYMEYLLANNALNTSVYGTDNDPSSNRLDFVIEPFIKIEYPALGQYEVLESNDMIVEETIQENNPVIFNDSSINAFPEIDENLFDDTDLIEFSFEMDFNELNDENIEIEIDNFIKTCHK